ncbi:hypothetical protein [Streptomyces sp. TR06-5]|uniref:hypothetical protein n=1 Tax=unclassified Streptomyces TaxID=2593676 RepID=UPI0039A2105F
MTDRSRHADDADPAHESDDTRGTEGQEQPGGSSSSRGRPDPENGADNRDGEEDNPFAAPPEGEPDKPWRPRRPESGPENGSQGGPPWGSRWSSRQPGRQDGGFGSSGGPEQNGDRDRRRTPGLRWDPTDPKQRHARYALHGGIWALFFALFGLTEIALLLGALSLYWGISALRGPSGVRSVPTAHATAADVAGTDRNPGEEAGASGSTGSDGSRPAGLEVTVTPAQAAKARRAAAVGGLVAGVMALSGVAVNFGQQLVYEEYYTCRADALTEAARQKCEDLPDGKVPPSWLNPSQAEQQN